MPDPLLPRGLAPIEPGAHPPAPASGPYAFGLAARPSRADFRAALASCTDVEPAAAPTLLREAALRIARGEQCIDRVIRDATRGRTLSNEELIALQATVYRYTQEVELAAKLVDRLTGAVRQTLTSQQ